jgi:hypothetical protein
MRDFWNRRSRRGKILLVVVGLLIVFSIIGALGDSGKEAATTAAQETTPAERDTTTAQTVAPPDDAEPDDCLVVPDELVRGIEEGLTTSGQGRLRNARAVRSDDPEGYLISADIQAAGARGRRQRRHLVAGGERHQLGVALRSGRRCPRVLRLGCGHQRRESRGRSTRGFPQQSSLPAFT